VALPDECIIAEHQKVYIEVLQCLVERPMPFMLGGAFGVWFYTDLWRHTHDIDIYTTPEHVQAIVGALESIGFVDIGEQAQGDRDWIYHAVKGDIVVDVIWRFANRLTYVTEEWFERASSGELLGMEVKFIPLEELVWAKIFIMNRHRCDWPDVMRVFRANCEGFDWHKLLAMVDEHWLLLSGVIDVFDWQFPADRDCVPADLRKELNRRREALETDPAAPTRERVLDPWIHMRPEDKCYLEP
jgi:hypothetical protein